METTAANSTAETRYLQLQTDRQHFIERGDTCAKLTLPTLFQRDATTTANMQIKDPAQTVGANGVNTLASKMVLSLLPMNTPFFKLNLDEITDDLDKELMKEVKSGLSKIERQAILDIENSGDVTSVFEALKHLIVVGNTLAYIGEKGTRVYSLNKYVVVRDPDGEWKELVICEEVSPTSLEPSVLAEISAADASASTNEKTLKMYTHVTRKDGRVEWHQEVKGVVLPDSRSSVPEEGNPWIPLRFLRVDGEAYGRSYIEMFLGDLKSLEILTAAVNDASAAAAKVIFLVRPNGTTDAKVLDSAPNMAVRSGDANDVTVLQMNKQADLRVAQEMIGTIERRLAYAFMMNAHVVRDAERVTAEEIRIVAQELDNSLGGIYSLLSKEFQNPYVQRRLFLLRKRKNIPKLPNTVRPAIVTGFAALGRGHDSKKLMEFLEKLERAASVAQMLGGKLNVDELISRIAIADGIELEGLMIPQPQQEDQNNKAMGMEMLNNLGPEVIKQAGPIIQQQMQGTPE